MSLMPNDLLIAQAHPDASFALSLDTSEGTSATLEQRQGLYQILVHMVPDRFNCTSVRHAQFFARMNA